ncbi:MAG: DNA repair exonuclease [Bryobacterales bacterium]|nr:DNA repair exonuclease [Bryobacteraceae bacterium]MDW8354732.1 DNA repair exonuclease [Bryobacterales bacterium]
MKFLHTADWQIGLSLAQLGEKTAEARNRRVATARRIAHLARSAAVDFVLIAGDIFEHNGLSETTVTEIASILSSFPCPVYLIPGNHDPAVPGSVWERTVWQECPNVHLLIQPQPVPVPGGILFPCPVRDPHATEDPTQWIPHQPTDQIRIGLAHGSVLGNPEIEPSYPISRNAPELRGLDYLALGHWHSTALFPPGGPARMAYAGTHEPTRFGEPDSGNVLVVEIPGPRASPQVEKRRVASLQWLTLERTVRQDAGLKELRAELERLPNPAHTLVECRLDGVLRRAHLDELEPVERILAERFFFGRLDTTQLLPEPEDAAWIENLPAGYLRQAARRLLEQAVHSPDPAAAEALRLLYRGLREVGL